MFGDCLKVFRPTQARRDLAVGNVVLGFKSLCTPSESGSMVKLGLPSSSVRVIVWLMSWTSISPLLSKHSKNVLSLVGFTGKSKSQSNIPRWSELLMAKSIQWLSALNRTSVALSPNRQMPPSQEISGMLVLTTESLKLCRKHGPGGKTGGNVGAVDHCIKRRQLSFLKHCSVPPFLTIMISSLFRPRKTSACGNISSSSSLVWGTSA